MIRERLKDIDIKITELANYLNVSRPTMYKFIDCYDSGQFEVISKPVLKLFEFIENNELIGKNNVVAFILNNIAEIDDTDMDEINALVNEVRQYISNNPASEKTQFISKCVSSSELDIIIHYIMEVASLLNQEELEGINVKKVEIYKEILNIYLGIDKEGKKDGKKNQNKTIQKHRIRRITKLSS